MTHITKDALDRIARERASQGDIPLADVVIKPADTEVTPAEQSVRDAYSVELEARAGVITDPAISREMLARSRRVQTSLPILEFYGRLAEIKRAEDDLQYVTGLEGIQLRAGLDESAAALRDTMVYPPLLQTIVERYQDDPKVRPEDYLTVDASEADRLSVAAAVSLLGLDVETVKAVRPLQERIHRLVAREMAPNRARLDALRRELADFRAEQERQGVRFS